jgi:hypothetical protein
MFGLKIDYPAVGPPSNAANAAHPHVDLTC